MKRVAASICAALVMCLLLVTSPGTAAAAQEKPIVLRVSTFFPPTHLVTRMVMEPLCKDIETLSKGRIKAQLFTGEVLGKAKDYPDMILKGMVDVGFIVQGYSPGRFPLSSITELPFAFSTAYDQSEATWKLYKSHLHREYTEYKTLGLGNTSRYVIGTPRKAARSLEDLKGLKCRTPGGYVTKVFEAIGVTPVSMPSVEVYNSLERGIIDGYGLPYGPISSLKLGEITKYVIELDLGTLLEAVLMNKKVYEKLPPDLQKAMDEAGDRARKNIPYAYENEVKSTKEALKQKGIEIITPPADQVKRIQKAGMKVWGDWLKEMEGKGLPAKTVMNAYLEMVPAGTREIARAAVR